ncbi:sensor histidine kinase [Intrasporangium flavum]|uniref:sensor histidine kinase n=1 Tax=Intrasporangium flavum TaxID=1428657 RepID=UPI001F613EEA|nr:histidine kinase [Intrasporangium flavum]
MTVRHPTSIGSAARTATVRSRAVRRFVWWSLLALLVCAVGVSLAVRAAAADIAVLDASRHGANFARHAVAPLVNQALRDGEPTAVRALEGRMESPMRDGSMVRIKVWDQGGHVIWSDAPALHGESFDLEPEEAALFGTDAVLAHVSDLSKEENATEQAFDELLEVYAATSDADGQPILVESYWGTSRILDDEIVISSRIVPLTLAALLLFMLAVIPLGLSLARRVDAAQDERASLLRHALAASDIERRKVSRELHDGLIQDLTGLGYSLPAIARQLPEDAAESRQALETLSQQLQTDISALRAILTDLYPVSLTREGLAPAIEQVAAPVRAAGIDVVIHIDPTLNVVSREAVELAYQVAREGLRNVVKHARATTAWITADTVGDEVVVTVTDDGDAHALVPSGEGHLGLRLIEDSVTDIGGSFSAGRASSGGAQLVARFPKIFVWSWAR